MKDFILRAKPWLLFIPLIVPTLISFYFQYEYMGWISDMQKQALTGTDPAELFDIDLASYRGYFLIYLLLFGLSLTTALAWYHSVATGLREYLPADVELKQKRYKLAFSGAVAYIVLLMVGQYFAFGWAESFIPEFFGAVSSGEEPDFGVEDPSQLFAKFMMVWALVMVTVIVGTVSMAYVAYYAGKTIRCIEQQKALRGSAVAGYAILAYFLMIGIWILQPKIRRLLKTGDMKDPELKAW